MEGRREWGVLRTGEGGGGREGEGQEGVNGERRVREVEEGSFV